MKRYFDTETDLRTIMETIIPKSKEDLIQMSNEHYVILDEEEQRNIHFYFTYRGAVDYGWRKDVKIKIKNNSIQVPICNRGALDTDRKSKGVFRQTQQTFITGIDEFELQELKDNVSKAIDNLIKITKFEEE